MNKNNNEVKFKCIVEKCAYNSPNYKVYAVSVDKEKYPNIKHTKYSDVSINGDIHELGLQQSYEVTAVEQHTKYGYGYKVKNIRKDKPLSENDMYIFLKEILTENQASELWREYPDIVDRIIKKNSDNKDDEENDNNYGIDFSRLKGIKEATFEKIKDKIIKNYVLYDLVVEFDGLLSISMLKKLYEEYPSVQQLKNKLISEPYKSLTKISGIGFIRADSILLMLEESNKIHFKFDLRTSKQRCHACMTYLLEKNEEDGNTKMDLRDLRKQIIKQVPACADHFVECLKSNDFYYDKDTFDVSIKDTYSTEKYIANVILRAIRNPRIWNIDYASYRNKGEYELTDEQIGALECICNNNIMILNGYAGSGKSATASILIKMLEDYKKTYKLFAPTGRAAKVLSEYTDRAASTIHRGLGYMPPEWTYGLNMKLDADVVIIDEFSMTDTFLFAHVIDAIDFNKTKLIMIGDSAQIPSVGAGRLLYDFINSGKIPTVTLNQIFRYCDGGLMAVATDVRNTKKYLSNISSKCTSFGKNNDYIYIESNNYIDDLSLLYKKLIKTNSVEDIQILTSYNKGDYGTITINKMIQKIANKNYGSQKYIKSGDNIYYKDDIVMQTKNNYHAEVYINKDFVNNKSSAEDENDEAFIPNGMIGKIVDILNNGIVVDFDGVLIKYSKDSLIDISLAYCISIHKSQGGSAKIIILVTPPAHTYMLNSNLIYVGLTRTKEKCYHIGNLKTVNIAVKKKEDVRRNTFMSILLNN